MLEVDPQQRPTAQQVQRMWKGRIKAVPHTNLNITQVLQCHWIRGQGPDVSIRGDILTHLRTFANQSRMRRQENADHTRVHTSSLLPIPCPHSFDKSSYLALTFPIPHSPRLLLGLMAASISGGEANRLLDHFYAMDSDFSGTIEMQELAQVAKQVCNLSLFNRWGQLYGPVGQGNPW